MTGVHPRARIGADATVHPTAIVETDVIVGAGTAIWDHAHVRHGARIGAGCILGGKTYIAYGVLIGERCKLNSFVYVCAGVTLGRGVMVGAHTCFTNDKTPRATGPDLQELRSSAPGDQTLETVVHEGATLGARVTVGPGLTIGRWAMVGMGSVVTRDVPAHGLVLGNPARMVGLVDRNGQIIHRLAPGEAEPPSGSYPTDDGFGPVVWPPTDPTRAG